VHQEGVYHLDLKPDNIMLTSDGRIVLIDFGAARQDMSSLMSTQKKSTTSAFTMEYAPPELLGGQPAGAATDLFELSMILHEMLTGVRPEAALNRLLRDNWAPSLSEPWQGMVTGSLRLRPEERPQQVKQWWRFYTDWQEKRDNQKYAETQRQETQERETQRFREAEAVQREAEQRRLAEEQAKRVAAENRQKEEQYRQEAEARARVKEVRERPLVEKGKFLKSPHKILCFYWTFVNILVVWVSFLAMPFGPFISPLFSGLGQWLILRQYIPKFAVWILTTFAGLSLGLLVAFGMAWPIIHYQPLIDSAQSFALVLIFGFIPGLSMGMAQWLVLRRRVFKAYLWIEETAKGLVIGTLIFILMGGANNLFQETAVPPILIGIIILSVIQGLALNRLLQESPPR
jgi:Protein kinase domain